MFTKEMQKALKADGEKLRQLTGEDHGPIFLEGRMTDMDDVSKNIYRARGHLDAASKLDMRANEIVKSGRYKAVARELRRMADAMRDLAYATRNQSVTPAS